MSNISPYGSYDMAYTNQSQIKHTSNEYQSQIRSLKKMTEKNKKRKKKLNYNPREISSALRRTSKSGNAAVVLSKARAKLSTLLKCKSSGMYDDKELRIAIEHAEKLVRCGKMKVAHLKQEEQQRKLNDKAEKQERKKHGETAQRSENHRKQELMQQEKVMLRRIKDRERSLSQTSTDHRNKERKELDEADLEYMKRCIDNYRREQAAEAAQAAVSQDGIVREIGDGALDAGTFDAKASDMTEASLSGTAEAGVSVDVAL